ncbi:MAG: CopD family protein [Gammaproteobacteria bacterium]|nr:CopD family protein [Gammaproteobacteria bacterium]
MLWFKALHLIFMVTWFAGLFYLPRLFLYHTLSQDPASLERFTIMERKLFAIMTLGAALTLVFGISLLLSGAYLSGGVPLWLKLKFALLGSLLAYHWHCGRLIRVLRQGKNTHSHIFYRWYNEFPAVILVGIVLLAVFRPS